ncbi:MAG: hypothetical protein O7G85_09380 [Planctomycetota bacterium]|nr:hypothetical protein [Planctomycetota bacterium]
MAKQVKATFFFIDGSKITLTFERQAGDDHLSAMSAIRAALEQDKFAAEVNGDLYVMPLDNVKYIRISPAPPDLPKGVIRKAKLVE